MRAPPADEKFIDSISTDPIPVQSPSYAKTAEVPQKFLIPQAYSIVPESQVIEPTYKPRFGYWILQLASVYVAIFALGLLWIMFKSRIHFNLTMNNRTFEYLFTNLLGFKILGAFHVIAVVVFLNLLKVNKKLTTEPGNYWKVFILQFSVIIFLPISFISVIGYPIQILLIGSFACAIVSATTALVLTIPEDYDGCCACLKCLKPWKVVQVLPAHK